ncbi:chromophore lyase CpcT/CpeT [Sodalinema gerasimenkoae]|uniref:chromophore lyase CpcT/CpeT n=1 Tax=Sodalinema gerasimenkoae TaxID=2862348 RepID=UPI00135ACA6E|nr:chromophore lyase CpcT/CpeT [Sodalinema gerasimenkoae]
MSSSSLLKPLAQALVGVFDNHQQAQDNPTWFVPTRVWQYPLSQQIDGNYAIFVEQAPLLKLEQPYRQRLMLLSHPEGAPLQVMYRAFRHPEAIAGAARDPQRLQGLTSEDVLELPGCCLQIRQEGDRFIANPPQGAKCCFEYQGKTRQVELGFDITPNCLYSRDRGVDPDSGQGLWGALMGAYEYRKYDSFPLPETWT